MSLAFEPALPLQGYRKKPAPSLPPLIERERPAVDVQPLVIEAGYIDDQVSEISSLMLDKGVAYIYFVANSGMFCDPDILPPSEMNLMKGRPSDQPLGAIKRVAEIKEIIDFKRIRESNDWLKGFSDEDIILALKAVEGFCFLNLPLREDCLEKQNCISPHVIHKNADGVSTVQILHFKGAVGEYIDGLIDVMDENKKSLGVKRTRSLAVTSANRTQSQPAPVTQEERVVEDCQDLGITKAWINQTAAYHGPKIGTFTTLGLSGELTIARHGNIPYEIVMALLASALGLKSADGIIPAGVSNTEDRYLNISTELSNRGFSLEEINHYLHSTLEKIKYLIIPLCTRFPRHAGLIAETVANMITLGTIQDIDQLDIIKLDELLGKVEKVIENIEKTPES